MATNDLLKLKYIGALKGVLAGDCIGRFFEGVWKPNLVKFLVDLENLNVKKFVYTDDTALTIAVCESLIESKGLNNSNLISSLIEQFIQNPNRGYASGAQNLFSNLKSQSIDLKKDCFKLGLEMFSGTGSFGNGSGMRATPLALYTLHKPIEEMFLIVNLATKLTHSHPYAVLGAHLQCLAVRFSLENQNYELFNNDPNKYFDNFLNEIIEKIEALENLYDKKYEKSFLENLNKYEHICENIEYYLKVLNDHPVLIKTNKIYSEKLKKLKKLYKRCCKGEIVDHEKFFKKFYDCGVEAHESIPVALFAFLVACNKNCEKEVNDKLKTDKTFTRYGHIERVILYAVSLGGDTDTIASMAGGITGAFFGSNSTLMPNVFDSLENINGIISYGEKLFQLFGEIKN